MTHAPVPVPVRNPSPFPCTSLVVVLVHEQKSNCPTARGRMSGAANVTVQGRGSRSCRASWSVMTNLTNPQDLCKQLEHLA